MVRKTREEALLTRELLLDAAEHVFRARGVGHASLAEVADAAGLTRGAVYWHFDSKAALFQAMVDRADMPHDACLQKMENSAGSDPLAALRAAAVESLLRVANDERARRVYDVVFLRCEYTEDLAAVRNQYLQSRQNCYEKIERTMRAAVQHGQLPAHVDVRCATRGLYAFISGLMRDSIETPEQIDLVRSAETLVDTYLLGLQHMPTPTKRRAHASAAPRKAVPRKPAAGAPPRPTRGTRAPAAMTRTR